PSYISTHSFSFFFSSSADHRDLHSFPTRRSSDLKMPFVTRKHLARRTLLRGIGVSLALPLLDSMSPAFAAAVPKTPRFVGLFSRSEEHTSELQSPCNLVCRLLLEKKKNKINSE